MANYTPTQAQKEAFIAQMTQRMAEVAQKLADWVTAQQGPDALSGIQGQGLQIGSGTVNLLQSDES